MFVRDLAEGAPELRGTIERTGKLDKFQFINIEHCGERYPLQAVYFSFSDFHLNTDCLQERKTITYQGKQLRVEDATKGDFPNSSLVLVGLDPSHPTHKVKETFQRFRPKFIQLYQSESGKSSCAVVTFSNIKDRDRAILGTLALSNVLLYPSYDRIQTVVTHGTHRRETTSTDEVVFVYKSKRYVCNREDVDDVCEYVAGQTLIEIDLSSMYESIPGNFEIIINFLRNRTIIVDEMNAVFLSKIAIVLGISCLFDIDIGSYLTMNNIVYMANCGSIPDDMGILKQFCIDHLPTLVKTDRIQLLPVPLILELLELDASDAKLVNVHRLLIQTQHSREGKTEIAKHVELKGSNALEFRRLILDEGIDFNALGKDAMRAYIRTVDAPPFICLEGRNPFEGIFHFLAVQSGGNPHVRGVVTLEASSTQVSTVHRILDYDTTGYFSTRDIPGQWIKFRFNYHRVSLSGYTYKTHSVVGNGHSKSWKLEASQDGVTWRVIHEVNGTVALVSCGAVYRAWFPPTAFYSYFKITQTAPNSINYNNFRVANIEFFGRIRNR